MDITFSHPVMYEEQNALGVSQINQYLQNNIFCIYKSYRREELSVTFITTWPAYFLPLQSRIFMCARRAKNKYPYNCGNLRCWLPQRKASRPHKCQQSSKKFLSDALKQSKRQSISAAGRQGGTERSGRAIFSEQLCFCTCACIHARGKPVDIKCVILVEAAVMQTVTGSPWIIHTAALEQVPSNCFGENSKSKCRWK